MIKTYTWVKDTSELIDFENGSFEKDVFKIKNPSKILQKENEIFVEELTENDLKNSKSTSGEEDNKIGEIRVNNSKFYYKANIKDQSDSFCENLSWLIYKGKMYPAEKSEYKIKEGDILKLGRLWLIIKGIHIGKKINYYMEELDETNINEMEEDEIEDSIHINNNSNVILSIDNNINISKQNENLSNNDILNFPNQRDKNKLQRHIGYELNNNDEEIENCGSHFPSDNKKLEKIIEEKERVKTPNYIKLNDQKKQDKGRKISFGSLDANNIRQTYSNKMENGGMMMTGDYKGIKNVYKKENKKKNRLCRICYLEEDDPLNNPLIKPCKCSGSMKFIHLYCLLHWLKTKVVVKRNSSINNNFCNIYAINKIECELCKEHLPDYIRHNKILYSLIDYELENTKEENSNYIIIDTISGNNSTTNNNSVNLRYIVKFNKKNEIKIGRGLDMQMILNDISVSRNHCKLKLVNNNKIYLEDNNSKFGTLILVQNKHLEILPNKILTLQCGRTFLDIFYKKPFNILDCCHVNVLNDKKSYAKMNNRCINLKKSSTVITESESDSDSENSSNENNENINSNVENRSLNEKENIRVTNNDIPEEKMILKDNNRETKLGLINTISFSKGNSSINTKGTASNTINFKTTKRINFNKENNEAIKNEPKVEDLNQEIHSDAKNEIINEINKEEGSVEVINNNNVVIKKESNNNNQENDIEKNLENIVENNLENKIGSSVDNNPGDIKEEKNKNMKNNEVEEIKKDNSKNEENKENLLSISNGKKGE